MSSIVIEDRLADYDTEDGGRAKIALLCSDAPVGVRIISTIDNPGDTHEVFDGLIGKKLRITIEVVE